jgi:AcrR family transcriptional regulator
MPRKTPRRHQQGDESRLRILDATLAIASERGYEGTSIGLVTQATGLPASSVYWHFKNKDELLAATLEHSYRKWRATAPTWRERLDFADPAEEIRDRFHRASRAITESPEFWRHGLLLALESRTSDTAARRRFLEVRGETQETIQQWWIQVLPADALSRCQEVAVRLARFHLAMMDGLYVGIRSGRGWDIDRMVDLMSAGVYAQAMAWLEEAA